MVNLLYRVDSVRERVRNLVLRYGWNATCYQTVNPVFEYSFFPEFSAVVAFVRARGRRIVAGAPICPFDKVDEVIQRFRDLERSPVLYFGAGERVDDALRKQPRKGIVSLGAQPVWHPKLWRERVLTHKSLRYQFRRAAHKGVIVREWDTKHAENSPALHAVLTDWLQHRGLPPLHFLVEPETLDYLKDRRTFVAEIDGRPVAFLNLCPVPQRNGWLTEQFPRLRKAPNGTIDLLMHEAAQIVASEGAEYLTMGLVPFSAHGHFESNPLWLRFVMNLARAFGTPLYSFRGFDEFKSKFVPEYWEPVYAAADGRSFGAMDLLAVLEAFAGQPYYKTITAVIRKRIRPV